MTSPQNDQVALLSEVRVKVDALTTCVSKLERTVDGDSGMGVPSLRKAVRDVADELKNEAESLCDRVDKLEQAARTQEAYLRGMTTLGKWLGGSSLLGLLGLIGQLMGWFGGGGK